MKLQQIDQLPEGLLQLDATQLHARLGGPTLLHLPGRREPALFVAVLMHGNETTSWEAIRRVLGRYLQDDGELKLPRSLSLFIANTEAAAEGLRHLPGQPDFNRVWPGAEAADSAEAQLMRQVVDEMAGREIFASIDLHNNTGINPHYACVNVMEHAALHLAALFSRTVVYFVRPRGVASMAMAALGPSVTLECGKVGQQHGTEHAAEYVDACLHLAELPQHPVPVHDIDLFHTVAVVRVPPKIAFGFGDNGYALDFNADLDRLNFRELPAGTSFGRIGASAGLPLDVRDEQDHPVTERYFQVVDGQLLTRLPLMPSMLTCDATVIRQDCLCYLMERYDRHLSDAG
jgi:succinylglutamate desuccinylase